MASITPADLSRRLHRDDVFVLDVRRAPDFDEWHVPGSENIDVLDELRTDPEAAKDALSAVPAGREVVVVRAAGPPAEMAAAVLREMGYDVHTLACTRP